MFFSRKEEMEQIQGTLFDQPATVFDPILGYRWVAGTRCMRVAKGEVVYDHVMPVNNEGCHCTYDYEHKKGTDRTFRFFVLGDSFTNDAGVEIAWPETLQHLLRGRSEYGIDVEVYGMPTDGGGLPNWYTTLHEYILPNFDIDGLIIADWGDDLTRDWVVCHSEEDGFLWKTVGLDERPKNVEEVLAMKDQMNKLYEICSKEHLAERAEALKANADPKPYDCNSYGMDARIGPEGYEFTEAGFKKHYTEDRYDLLKGIMDSCKQRGIKVIYSVLPEIGDVMCSHDKPELKQFHPQVGEWIGDHFNVPYFDGLKIFDKVERESILESYWLKYDGHWGQGASMYYAINMADFILRNKIMVE